MITLSKDQPNIYLFSSLRDYLNELIHFKISNNNQFSIRAFSKKVGIANSSMSDYLSGKSSISVNNALKIANSLKIEPNKLDYFLTMLLIDSSKSSSNKEILLKRLSYLKKKQPDEVESKVLELIQNSIISEEFRYNIPNTLTFRVLTRLKDKHTGKALSHFIDRFFSSERQVAASGYFLKNTNNTYSCYVSQDINAKVNPKLIDQKNKSLSLTFDENGFPSVEKMTIVVLGTTRLRDVTLSFNHQHATMNGIEYDTENTTDTRPVNIRYDLFKG